MSFRGEPEVERVHTKFLKGKLALTNPVAANQPVNEETKGDRTKSRVAVYRLLPDHFGRLARLHERSGT